MQTRAFHHRRENIRNRPLSKAMCNIWLVSIYLTGFIFVVQGKAELSFYLTPEDFSWSDYKPDRSESIAPVIDLNGEWQYQSGKKNGTVHVPSCYAGYSGIVTFTKQFVIPEDWRGKACHLIFYGIQHRATFHLNDAILGSREGSNIPFEISVPNRYLNFGETNTLMVEVDNRKFSRANLPLKSSIFPPRNYGGIAREVFLIALPPERIDSYNIKEVAKDQKESEQPHETVFELDLTIVLGKDSAPVDVTAEVFNPDGKPIQRHKITVTGEKDNQPIKKTVRLSVSPTRRWCPDNPYRYKFNLSLTRSKKLLDRIERSFGLRPERSEDFNLLDAYKLDSIRGISRVEQWPRSGVSPSPRQLQEEMRIIQELDINFVHCIYFPPHPYFLDMCDSLGILLSVEIPLFGVSTRMLSEPNVQSVAFSSMRDLQDLARSHPSVAMLGWGSRLERTALSPGGIIDEWIQNLNSDLPYYIHTIGSKTEKAGIYILEPYPLTSANSQNPIIDVSASAGHFTGELADEERAHNLEQRLNLLSRSESSFVVNSLNDWYGDKPLVYNPPQYDLYLHTTGLTFASRQPRKAFYVLQKNNTTVLTGSGKNAETSGYEPIWQFLVTGLVFTGLGLWIMRVDNLFRQNLRRAMMHSVAFFSDIRDRRFLQGSSTLFLIIFLAVGFGNMIASVLYACRFKMGISAIAEHLIGYNPIMVLMHAAAWYPARGIVIAVLCTLGLLFLFGLLIRLGSPRQPRKLTLFQSFHILFWSSIPALIILPLSGFYLRLEHLPLMQWLIILIIIIALLWFYTRLVLAVSVGYRSGILRSFIMLVGLPVFLVISYIFSIHFGRQSLYYVTYIINLFNLG